MKGHRAFDYRSSEGVIAVKWLDKKCVNFLSIAYGIEPLSTVKVKALVPIGSRPTASSQPTKLVSKVGRPLTSSPSYVSTKKRSAPRPSNHQPDEQHDYCGHLPLHCDKWGLCNLCPKGVSPDGNLKNAWFLLCLNASQQFFVLYHQKLSGSCRQK
ncbi:unnamed protein product [Lepeophtheirus salmonis]|uniref:(salmon louse) hypothetical protein n=1 Tax=Lepeophtheirus salmonis TaxID=72036 RepID=A0A7R8H982_LEPSM|nr:unnamed protein product [Lepeophtheirus salmonis]CAF2954515.1 unnamed protein product [Lepeophtheirus salmonis]